jgi:ABC-type Na+ efflux pump permease subunit
MRFARRCRVVPRERHSLQPLLTHSVSALHIVLGKFLALALVNVAGAALCIAVSLLLLERSAIAELGLRVDTGLATGLSLCLLLIPLSLLVTATQLAVSLFTKTAKEAQQSAVLFSILPLFAVMGFALAGVCAWAGLFQVGTLLYYQRRARELQRLEEIRRGLKDTA